MSTFKVQTLHVASLRYKCKKSKCHHFLHCSSVYLDIYFSAFQAFSVVFMKAIDKSEPADEVHKRVINLIDCITYSVFSYTTRGLFERDKLIFTTQMCLQV